MPKLEIELPKGFNDLCQLRAVHFDGRHYQWEFESNRCSRSLNEREGSVLCVARGSDGKWIRCGWLEAVPKGSHRIAYRISPAIFKTDQRFETVLLDMLPQMGLLISGYHDRYRWHVPKYDGDPWTNSGRFMSLVQEVDDFLELNTEIWHMWKPLRDYGTGVMMSGPGEDIKVVDLPEDLEVLIKLKFTKARVDA